LTELRIGGWQPWSSCDWPGELTATVFCRGCPWCCPYCYNQSLRSLRGDDEIAWAGVSAFLATRRGLLDGVVFSGGEPLAQSALFEAMAEVRALGFRVGLHTGGFAPERFARVLPLVDWVGFDVKAPFDEYDRITGAAESGKGARASFEMLLSSGVAYELRTTVHPAVLDSAALTRMAAALSALGAENWVLQAPRNKDGTSIPAALGLDELSSAITPVFPAVTCR
jgi:pyruvate formate lyase activating enzyme